MKLIEKLKDAKNVATEKVRKYIPTIAVGSGILLIGGTMYFVVRNQNERKLRIQQLEESGKKILRNNGWYTVIEGSGPIWDSLKQLFKDIDMEPFDDWIIEADKNGNKIISHIPNGNVFEELEI